MPVTLTPAENFLTDEDLGEARSAIRSVLSETFGRAPFTLKVPTRIEDAYGGSDTITYDNDQQLMGLFTTAERLLKEDQHNPVELGSDAVLVLSRDYLADAAVNALQHFHPKYDRETLIDDGTVLYRIRNVNAVGQLADTPLVIFVELERAVPEDPN